jgi:hypothetical protein
MVEKTEDKVQNISRSYTFLYSMLIILIEEIPITSYSWNIGLNKFK